MNYRYIPSKLKIAALALSVGAALTGCIGATDQSEQIANQRLDQARMSYAEAKANPLVEAYSLKTLLGAEKALQEAERVQKEVNSQNPADSYGGHDAGEKKLLFNDISRLAYISERKSQTSVALAEGVEARNEIVKLGREKAEVHLLKSQLEQQLLQKDLDDKGAALKLSRQQLGTASDDAERARIMADIMTQEAAYAKAQANAEAIGAEQARAEAEWQARAAELARAEAEDQTRAAELAKNEAQAQTLKAENARAEMVQLMAEMTELQGQLTDRGIVLTIGDVLFATGKSDLNASAQRSMGKLAEFLQNKPNRNLLIEGHTDNVGNDLYNQGLSEQRAAAVKIAMVDRGISSERIATIGYGKNYPLASNDNAAGKQQNRRVEAIILNAGVVPDSQFRN